jgi:hypothetical protein
VNWHATLFGERLEKALSEEKLLSERFLDLHSILHYISLSSNCM